MEAAYDKNNSNCAFDNAQMISAPTLPKNCYNESNDVHITDEPIEVVDSHQRFEDDFGPETDVDAMDETTLIKLPAVPQEHDSSNEFSLSNGTKPFSLENKIMQQLSEQNQIFLTDSNPFKNDNFDQYSDDHAILDQTTKSSDDSSSEVVVDNKIIDALESLAVSNGENEKYEHKNEKPGNLIDIRQQSSVIPDFTEKADYVHEKNTFIADSAAKPDETFMQHSDSTFSLAENHNSSLMQDDTHGLVETRCVDESVGEDSEEEEWNYIKGDKTSEENHNSSAAEHVADSPQSSETQLSESVFNLVSSTDANSIPEPQFFVCTSEDVIEKTEDFLEENEKIDEPKEIADSITKTEGLVHEAQENTAVSIEQELADYKNNFACTEIISSSEYPDSSSFENIQNLNRVPNLLLEETSLLKLMTNPSSSSEIAADNEVVVENIPLTDILTEEASSSEKLTKDLSMSTVEKDTGSAEVVIEETSVEKQKTETLLSEETSGDEELERPDSLSFEMASKLNPEAKEFVPVSSPTRSNPTSPVNAPCLVPHSFSMLEDTVVAQSPKKFTTTMDNIDLPAEDDFQHELNRRPHELEKPSEFVNGNADVSVRSNSPVSEPSYQELNLKEAMQADEKLAHDYSDEKEVVTENDNLSEVVNEVVLNVLNKEQDPMNMSIYESRDETLLSTSDELNKVHMLPELEDEVDESLNTNIDKARVDMHLFENKKEITEPEIILQTSCEEEVLSKTPVPEDSTTAPEDSTTAPEESTAASVDVSAVSEESTALPENSSAEIYAVASHVVNDVAALVSQMQIISPNDDFEIGEDSNMNESVNMPTGITTDNTKLDENCDVLVSLEQQNEVSTDIEIQSASHFPNRVENLFASEAENSVSPLVESLQNEVEYTTDEIVVNEELSTQSMLLAEDSSEPKVALRDPIEQRIELITDTTENVSVLPVVEPVDTETTRKLDTITTDLLQVATGPDGENIGDEKKPVIELKRAITKPTAKSSTTAKPTATKTTTTKPVKPVVPINEKRTAKPSVNQATTKLSATSKPLPTSTIKKTSTVSSASSTRSVKATKPATTVPIGRPGADGSATNKPLTEKKTTATVKKTTSSSNGEVKPGPVSRKPTTLIKSTTVGKSSAPSSGSTNSARASNTTARSATTKPSTTSTKPPTAAFGASSSTTSVRTSSTVPSAKPRTVPSTLSKTVSSTTTTSTVTSKPSSNAITKRFSTAGTLAPKTTTATTTTKTVTAAKTTNPVASRTSTVSKSNSTTVTGVRKITTTSPTKKPGSSTVTKTRPSSVKSPSTTKTAVSSYANGKISTEVSTADLLDLNKQFKNDNNQFITQNDSDSPMMVIDSAAD